MCSWMLMLKVCSVRGAACWTAPLIWIVFLPAITLGMHYVWRQDDLLSEIFSLALPSLLSEFCHVCRKKGLVFAVPLAPITLTAPYVAGNITGSSCLKFSFLSTNIFYWDELWLLCPLTAKLTPPPIQNIYLFPSKWSFCTGITAEE